MTSKRKRKKQMLAHRSQNESYQHIDESAIGVKQFSELVTPASELLESMDMSVNMSNTAGSNDYSSKCDLYDNMGEDSIISSALEMYADDSLTTTMDGQLFSVENKIKTNTSDISTVREFLTKMGIESKLWNIYYQLAKYGECYLELFYSRVNISDPEHTDMDDNFDEDSVVEVIQMDPYCEIVDRPDLIDDICYRGETLFFNLNQSANSFQGNMHTRNNSLKALPAYKYIHFTLGSQPNKNDRLLEISLDEKTEGLTGYSVNQNSKNNKKIYGNILRGRSILNDVQKAYRDLSLVENIAMMSKLNRSQITRVVNVEVGSMSKGDIRKALARVKSQVKNKVSINENTGSANYVDVTGIENMIINPTSQGKGALQIETLDQTEPDIKSVLDLNYFSNKLFGALRIPKAYLGFEADLNDSGGDTLAQISIRYSRTIRKIQKAVEEGLENICYLYCRTKGYDESRSNNVQISIQPPVTKEESDKLENMSTKVESISKIVEALPDDLELRTQVSLALMQELGNASVTNLISEYQEKQQNEVDTDLDADEGEENLDTEFSAKEDLANDAEEQEPTTDELK